MKLKIRTSVAIIIGILLLTLISACGSGGQDKADAEKYKDFTRYTYGHFDIYFSPKTGWLGHKDEIARGYERFLKEICENLEMPVPQDTIKLYIYTTSRSEDSIAGGKIPFSTDKAIHWAGYYPYGYELTKFLLRRRGIEPGQFHFINEGVPNVFDFSGLNYHDKTNRIINSGMLTPLVDLGNNDIFDTIPFTRRRAESASFAGFLIYNYGLDRLFMLWNSKLPWKESVETIFQIPIDEFQEMWKKFVRQFTDDPEGTIENDPRPDMKQEAGIGNK